MKKLQRRTIAILLCLAMAAMMFGCSAPAEDTPSDSDSNVQTGDGEVQELTFWFWGCSAEQQEAFQRTLVDPFNEKYPQYHMTVEHRNTVNKDVAVAMAANEGPDIIYESSPALALEYIAAGKYLNLDEYAEQFGWKDRIIGCMYDSGCVDGSLYDLAMGMNVIGIVYNKDVLEEHGWSVPTTMDELIAIMDEALELGMYASATGNKGWQATNEDYTSLFLTAFAGPEATYEALVGETPWTDERIVHAIETSAEWYQKGYLCSDYLSVDWSDAAMLLAEGRTPFFFGPYKFIQNLPLYAVGDMEDSFGFAPFPSEDPNEPSYYTIGATGTLAINANSKNPDGAALFLDMMLSNEFVHDIVTDWPGYWAVPITTLNEVDTSDLSGLPKSFLEAVQEAVASLDAGNFGYYNSSYMPAQTFNLLYTGIEAVWMGEQTAESLLQEMDEVFQEEMASGSMPIVPQQG